ncbi:MAG: hypothetical protein F7B18_00755 [Desulfurococcales archaeon]|nr:hypothetical protein [Desulfurococcales archaeon]
MVMLTQGTGYYDSRRGIAGFNGVEIKGEDMGVSLALSVIAACVSKKVSTILGLGRVEAILEAHAGLEALLAEEEPRVEYLILRVLVPEGVGEDEARSAALKCPVLGMVLGLVREVRVERLSS